MRAGAAIRPILGLACLTACIGASSAAAAPVIDLGLDDVKVPQVDLPNVDPPSAGPGGIKPPSVDLSPTIDSATNAVNNVTGGGSGGSPAANPPAATPPSGTAQPPAAPPANPPAETGNGSRANRDRAGTAATPGGSRDDSGRPSGNAVRAKAAGAGAAAGAQPLGAQEDSGPGALIRVAEAFSWTLFGVLLGIALIALGMTGRSATLSRMTRRLKHERGELTEDVGAMSAALLPQVPARLGDSELSVAYRSAGPASGGDFHDVVELDDGRLGILVGDACGHGRDALQTTALVHYTVRAYLEAGLQPRQAIRLADEKVGGKLGKDFVTVLCAIWDPKRSALDYSTAGHPAPIVIGDDPDHAISLLTDPPIGVGSISGNRQTRISISEGSQLCFFSDGLTEARDESGALIGRPGLVEKCLELGPELEAQELIDRLDETVSTNDDVTVLTLRPLHATGTGRVNEDIEIDPGLAALGELRYFLVAAGLSSNAALRTQIDARNRAGRGSVANLRIHRHGGGQTNWEFTDGLRPMPASPERTHLELVEAHEPAEPVGQPAS